MRNLILVIGLVLMLTGCQAYSKTNEEFMIPLKTEKTDHVMVERFEGDDELYAVVEVVDGGEIEIIDIPVEWFNDPKPVLRESIPFVRRVGKVDVVPEGYVFKSNDGVCFWYLDNDDLDFVPNEDSTYEIWYSENDTNYGEFECDIEEDHDCECYCYDDIFIKLKEIDL